MILREVAVEADDDQLLARYRSDRSDEAFSELVRRHVGLVYGSALRQVQDAHMAEDVTQTVFTLLARKARSVKARSLSGWLLAATRYAAANGRRSARRRLRHERNAARPEVDLPPARATADDACDLLDQALARLRTSDRQMVLLRYYEGKDAGAVATALGISEHAARKRLTRAIDRLRRSFASRGVTVAPALFALALGRDRGAPEALADAVARAATAPSRQRVAMAQAVWREFWRRRLIAAAPAVIAVLVGSGGAALVASHAWRAHAAARVTVIDPPLRPARPGLRLTIPWNGRFHTIPAPATFPAELRDTVSYREWESSGDARTFQWTTRDGRRYLAHASVRQKNGRRVAFISRVQLFRADGTLETETINDDRGEPHEWYVYGADGQTRQETLTESPRDAPGAPFVESLRLFDRDGTCREFQADGTGIIYAEWLLDGSGKRARLLNGKSTGSLESQPRGVP